MAGAVGEVVLSFECCVLLIAHICLVIGDWVHTRYAVVLVVRGGSKKLDISYKQLLDYGLLYSILHSVNPCIILLICRYQVPDN